jgi:hypothetical protein
MVDMKRSHTTGLRRSTNLTLAALLREQSIVSCLRDIEVAIQMIFAKLLMACMVLIGDTDFALSYNISLRRIVDV